MNIFHENQFLNELVSGDKVYITDTREEHSEHLWRAFSLSNVSKLYKAAKFSCKLV